MEELALRPDEPLQLPATVSASTPPAAPPSTSAGCTSQTLVDGLAAACSTLDIATTIDCLRAMHAKGMLYGFGGVGGIVGRAAESERSKLLLEILLLFAEPTTTSDRLSFEADPDTLEWAKRMARPIDRRREATATARHLLQLDDSLAVTAFLEESLSPSSPTPLGPPLASRSIQPSPTPSSANVLIATRPCSEPPKLDAAATSSLPLVEVTPPTPVKVDDASSSARSLDRPSPVQPELRIACPEAGGAGEGAQGLSGATFSSPAGQTDGLERAHDLASSPPGHTGPASPAPTLSPPPPPLASSAGAPDASPSSPTYAGDSDRTTVEQCQVLLALENDPKIKLEEHSPSPSRAQSLSDMELESSQEQRHELDTLTAAHGKEDVDVKPFAVVERTDRRPLDEPSSAVEPVLGPGSPSNSPVPHGLGIIGVAFGPSRSRIPQLAAPPPPPATRHSSSSPVSPAPASPSTARLASPPIAASPPLLPPARPASPPRKRPTAAAARTANQVPLGPRARWKPYPTPEFSPPPLALPPAPAPRPASPVLQAARASPPPPPPLVVAAAAAEPDEWVNPFAGPFDRVLQADPPPAPPPASAALVAPAAAPPPRSSLKRRAADAPDGAAAARRTSAGVRWAVPEQCVVGSGAGPVVAEEKERRSSRAWGKRGRR